MTRHHDERSFSDNPAENYETYFVPSIGAPVASNLLEAAALQAEERVLDVGCGTGVVARLAAEKTGAPAVGLDPNPAMLGVARSVTPKHMPIDWHEASAEAMPLPDDRFDVVLCQMALQFVPDKPSAIREMHRVLAPGGRLVLNTPGRMQPFFAIMEDGLSEHLGPEAGGFVKAVFSMHDPGEIQDLLMAGGFGDVRVQTTMVPLRLPAPGEFLWQYVHSTPLAGLVHKLEDDRLAALEQEFVAKADHLVEAGGVSVPQEVLVASGRK